MSSNDEPVGCKHGIAGYCTACNEESTVAALHARIDQLEQDKENLCTVMIAAAEEIKEHWDAHCDADGYGPANLLRRLEQGFPAQYGYTAGAFEEMQKRIAELEAAQREAALKHVTLFGEWQVAQERVERLEAVFAQVDKATHYMAWPSEPGARNKVATALAALRSARKEQT